MNDKEQPPFGIFAPTPRQRFFNKITQQLPPTYAGRKISSLLLGLAGGRAKRPKDVIVFGSQKARLYTHDNICEKRVYATPQFWDPAERNALADAITKRSQQQDPTFYFLDVGANAGLYTLFARSVAKKSNTALKAVCIEPDHGMRARLNFNIAVSKADDDIRVYAYAAAASRGPLQFSANTKSRGMNKVEESGTVTVQGAPLVDILLMETAIPRLDAMKIDIEGYEQPVLEAFFQNAPAHLLPHQIIIEISHDHAEGGALARCKMAGYEIAFTTKMNAVLNKVA